MQSPVVVILAAGLGTRMKSDTAKVLHRVAGRPLIIWAVEGARDAGAGAVVAVVGHQRDDVLELLGDRYGDHIGHVVQEEQRGTGHAVQCVLPTLVDEPADRIVVIVSGDAPLLAAERIRELCEACAASPSGMALLSTEAPGPMPYGRLVRSADGVLERIVEEKDATPAQREIRELNAGFYAVRLSHLRSDLESLSDDNAQGELYLTDLAAAAHQRGGAAVISAPWREVSGINDRIDLAAVDEEARLRINHHWMREGVTIVAPVHTFIDADAGPIGRDSWIGPGVHVRGTTRIGTRVRVDAGSVLDNVEIGDDTWVKPYSVLSTSKVGSDVNVGPFSHCRPGTVLDEGARVGNFVETKKTHIMAGAKANHLAYLGDASIGARANIGAGTITCNYDGFSKFRTTIEAGAFIGSDSQLVAPVTVGRDAYVGSGTTVTKDVPRSALALSRVKQVNKDGWAERFREVQRKRKSRSR